MAIENQPGSMYPSDFLDPQVKESKEYCLKWSTYVDGIGISGDQNGFFRGYVNNTNKYALWRAYARAQQPIDKYKPILGIRNKKERNNPNAISYRVLNWEILDIATKYVNVLIGKLLKQNNDIGVRAVDGRAEDERRKKKLQLQEYVINGKFYEQITQKTGIAFESPIQEDVVPPPQNLGEIDVHMNMFYKEDYCMIVQDMLKIINEQDNYQDILATVARDMVEIGVAATRTYRVGNKILRRACIPERMVVASSTKDNFEDVKYIGEYWDLTISAFKEIAGDQLTEAQYRDIAEKATSTSFDTVNVSDFYRDHLCYPWDNTKITVLDLVWFSADWETHQVKSNRYGNVEVQQKEFSWWEELEKQGVTEQSFNQVNKSKVIRYPLNNQYGCLWVKGTNYVVNEGKSKDILRNASSVGRAIGPFSIYKLKKCPIETVMPTLDNIQVNYLQYQHHAAKSRPDGFSIEFTALQDISIEGAGGKKITPKEALQIYFETGIQLWRRRDGQGNNSNLLPVNPIPGSTGAQMDMHWNAMVQGVNLLRDQLGLNELTDASTPNSEMGKAVAEMASGATNDALRPIHFAFDQVNLGTHEKTVMHISGMAGTGLAPEYAEALGIDSIAKLALLSDLTIHELGVYLLRQPTEEMKAVLRQYLANGITAKTLLEEEAMEIEMEPNIYKAIRLMKMYRQQKSRDAMAQAQAQSQMNADQQVQSSQAAAQAEMQAAQFEWGQKKEYEWEKAKATAWASKQTIADQAFLANLNSKLAKNEALTEEENRRLTELMKVDRQGSWNLKIAEENAKRAASTARGPSGKK